MLKKRLAIKDIFYSRHNVSTQYISRDELDEESLALIKTMNYADLKLFKWARDNSLELIENELTTNEIEAFKNNNQQWSVLIKS